uniref:2,4-dienoyl-CoA reductase [(3E)-enoyl-CoA-producing] n=1 Tax=Spongospora subterranea TaxID=70186 RepID=A0A0H5QTB1_9EUKA|eukprot:CRZ04957.1 hypothetical protein [Spongospora subterranea]
MVSNGERSRSVFRENILAGRVAFVTGGGSGIGFKISEALLQHGAKVAIGSRRIEVVQLAKKQLEDATNGSVIAMKLDVRLPESINDAVSETIKKWGKIDILINSAAGNFLASAESLSVNAFKTVMDIDANGTFLMSQAVFKQSMKKHGGSIINITATLHWNGELLQVHAGSAKAAIEGMTRHLANEWGQYNVRVNNVAPGPISGTTGFKKLVGNDGDGQHDNMLEHIALRRFGDAVEVADACVFLVSNASSYVTGSTITVDGGSWFFGGGVVGRQIAKLSRKDKMVSNSKL